MPMATQYSVSRTLSTFSLNIIHAIVWSKAAILLLFHWLSLAVVSPFKHKGLKTELIVKDSKTLHKIPLHLALILNEDEVTIEHLCMLVCWAFSIGIQWVSVYDAKGMVKRSVTDFTTTLRKQHDMFEGLKGRNLNVGTLHEYSSMESVTTGNNVIVLSSDDGYTSLSNVTTKLCMDSCTGVLHPHNIDPSKISSLLLGSIPEPNLAMVFGSSHSLLGYPPWWTRLVEILWLPSHHKLSYQQFLIGLRRYADCQQRFGK